MSMGLVDELLLGSPSTQPCLAIVGCMCQTSSVLGVALPQDFSFYWVAPPDPDRGPEARFPS